MRINKIGCIILVYDFNTKSFYKIPTGGNKAFICLDTFYSIIQLPIYNQLKINKQNTTKKLNFYKPIYFERFKYVGKGFKLILKRKKKFFNCVFGHSHIYWIKNQTIFTKKTRKYKHIFIALSNIIFLKMINILKKVKPINRYTLRGVRTYTHYWIKRKGRKSIATHV